MDLKNELTKQLMDDNSVKALSKTSGAKPKQVETIINAAVPMLLQGMRSNASSSKGAESLLGALTSHAGDDTSDIGAFLEKADINDGSKILGHLLGGSKEKIETGIAKKTGTSDKQVSDILSSLAPALLSLMGSKTQETGTKADGLGGLVGNLLGGDDDGFGLDDIAELLLSGKGKGKKTSSAGSLLSAIGNLFDD
ncbi:MAG: DUF937 domain-containing protein [Clostridia bacterium]